MFTQASAKHKSFFSAFVVAGGLGLAVLADEPTSQPNTKPDGSRIDRLIRLIDNGRWTEDLRASVSSGTMTFNSYPTEALLEAWPKSVRFHPAEIRKLLATAKAHDDVEILRGRF